MAKLTEKLAEREWEQLINRIREKSTPFPSDSSEKQRARKKRAKADPLFFMATYLPHYFEVGEQYRDAWKSPEKGVDWVHAGFPPYSGRMLDLADTIGVFGILAGFRESAKSTILSRGDVLHKMVYKLRRFVMFVAASADRGLQYSTPLKLEFENNLRLRQDFGDLVGSSQWTNDYFRTTDGVAAKSIGIDQNIRGENDLGARIEHLVFEDVEDPRGSMNPDQVSKYVSWIKGDALFAVNSKKWSGVYLCNYVSKRSIAHELLSGENTGHFNKVILSALIPNPKTTNEEKDIARQCREAGFQDLEISAWEARHPTLRLLQEEQNDPMTFRKERRQMPRGEDDRDFDDSWFIYFNPSELRGRTYRNFGWLDPASGKTSENTRTKRSHHALIVLTVTRDLYYYVRYAMIRRVPVLEVLNRMYELEERYQDEGGVTWGCEDVAFQAVLDEVVEMMAKEKGRRLDFTMIPTPTNMSKEDRILKKQRLIQKGFCKFGLHHSDQSKLVRGFLDFPHGSEDGPVDGPDAWERCVTLSERYMGARDRRMPIIDVTSVAKREAVFEGGAW